MLIGTFQYPCTFHYILKLCTNERIVCVGCPWTVNHTERKLGPNNYMGKLQPILPGSQQCHARIPANWADNVSFLSCLPGQGDLHHVHVMPG